MALGHHLMILQKWVFSREKGWESFSCAANLQPGILLNNLLPWLKASSRKGNFNSDVGRQTISAEEGAYFSFMTRTWIIEKKLKIRLIWKASVCKFYIPAQVWPVVVLSSAPTVLCSLLSCLILLTLCKGCGQGAEHQQWLVIGLGRLWHPGRHLGPEFASHYKVLSHSNFQGLQPLTWRYNCRQHQSSGRNRQKKIPFKFTGK